MVLPYSHDILFPTSFLALFLGLYLSLAATAPNPQGSQAQPGPSAWVSSTVYISLTELYWNNFTGEIVLTVPTEPTFSPILTNCTSTSAIGSFWQQTSCNCNIQNNTNQASKHDLFCDLTLSNLYSWDATLPQLSLHFWGAFNDSSKGIPLWVMNQPNQYGIDPPWTITSLHN